MASVYGLYAENAAGFPKHLVANARQATAVALLDDISAPMQPFAKLHAHELHVPQSEPKLNFARALDLQLVKLFFFVVAPKALDGYCFSLFLAREQRLCQLHCFAFHFLHVALSRHLSSYITTAKRLNRDYAAAVSLKYIQLYHAAETQPPEKSSEYALHFHG
jgi:hypothetical protein